MQKGEIMNTKRFLFFPLFFPKSIQKLIDSKDVPTFYDEFGKEIKVEGSIISPPINEKVPQPDFNSLTTATVNVPQPVIPVDQPDVFKEDLNPQSMDLIKTLAYCLKCKDKCVVLNPEYYEMESRKGTRNYLKGSCSKCGSKINAIVKKGGG
jgi:hypothetical protein